MCATRSRALHRSLLSEVLAQSLVQLEAKHGYDAMVKMLPIASASYYKFKNDKGNPTLRMVEEIATNLNLEPFEFFGFTRTEVRRALKRKGFDYDRLLNEVRDFNKMIARSSVKK